jgi:hypothetical protein
VALSTGRISRKVLDVRRSWLAPGIGPGSVKAGGITTLPGSTRHYCIHEDWPAKEGLARGDRRLPSEPERWRDRDRYQRAIGLMGNDQRITPL